MEQLVILVIIGLISLVNWLMQRAAEKREAAKLKRVERTAAREGERRNIYTQPPPVPAAGRRPSAPPPQDPFKELMDALGLPSGQTPPPVLRREEPRPPVVEEEEFGSLEDAPPQPLPKRHRQDRVEPAWKQPSRGRQPDDKERVLASAFAQKVDGEAPKQRTEQRSINSLLSDRASQRQAIILAEILSPPRALKPVEELPAFR